MNVAIIIPSRYGSTRLVGKPLADIAGISLIQRVWDIANAVRNVEEVYIATDDTRIAKHVESFGGRVIMTPMSCANGSERVLCAAKTLSAVPTGIINLQGDAVLTPPWVIERLVEVLRRDSSAGLVTPAVRMTWQAYEDLALSKASGDPGGTLVVSNVLGNALYFSKSTIPFVRKDAEFSTQEVCPIFRHIGIYGYRLEMLERLLELEEGPLESAEKLEQLRALENGIPVRIVEVDYRGRTHGSVDSHDDIIRVEAIIRKEGELLG